MTDFMEEDVKFTLWTHIMTFTVKV